MTRGEKNALAGTGIAAAIVLAGLTIYYTSRKKYPKLNTVSFVDLEKYAGEWYEIAKLPAKFEKACDKVKANYSVNEDGSLKVVNSCHTVENGKIKEVTLKATVADKESNARLNLQYFWPFKGDYQIIELGPDYEYALVGTEDRKYLWFLSRTPELDLNVMGSLMEKAREEGYNTDRVIFTGK